ncbi:MAG: hypothetical protein ACTS27_03425 [Phycisphaerales bacterium]
MPDTLTLRDDDLARLLDKLENDTPALTPREVGVLASALRALAADQLMIVRMQRALAIHGESAARLDAIIADARSAVQRVASGASPAESFDPSATAAARTALARRVDAARTGRDVILAALAFARDIAPAL